MTKAWRRRAAALMVLLLVTCWGAAAEARESVAALAKKLRTASDFRVRTQAALALGATGAKQAVDPLCGGLDDKSDTVRAAAAAGLGRLQQGGKSCLERRLSRETSANVKKMIKKTLGLLQEGESGPALSKSSRYYIAVAKTSARGTSASAELDARVRAALRRAAASYRGYVFAPGLETAAQAKKRLRKHPQVIGFRFEPTVVVQKEGDSMKVRFVLQIQEYPEGGPMGRLMRAGGFNGAGGDVDAKQDALVERLCAEAMQDFDKLAAQLD